MRRIKNITKLFLLTLLFYCVVTGSGALNAATVKYKNWSFEFKAITVLEAVNNISKISGVKIVLNGDADKWLLTKSYKDYTIESMLIDMFSGKNIAALFQYSEKELASVNIWILPKTENGNTNFSMPIFANTMQVNPTPAVSPLQEYKEIQGFVQEFGIQPEIIISADQKDGMKESEETKRDYIYFSVLNKSNSTTKDKKEDFSSNVGDEADNDYQEIIVPPSPEPEKFGGLEPPPMPPGLITLNK